MSDAPDTSESVPPDAGPPGTRAEAPRALERARWISHVLDDLVRIPGTRRRVGLDPLFGLVPGLGDWLPLLVSFDLLVTAARLDAGVPLLARMLGHIVIDAMIGTIPLLGDVFDAGWKANRRNLALLERLLSDRERTRRTSRWLVAGALTGASLVILGGIWLGWRIAAWAVGGLLG